MKEGIVFKVREHDAIVCSDGAFIRIKRKGDMQLGQRIFFDQEDLYSVNLGRSAIMKGYKKYVAIAASLLLFVSAGVFWSRDSYASIVVVDINPSVQLKLDAEETVIDVKALNKDGKTLELEPVVGMSVSDAADYITEQAVQGGFLVQDDLRDDFILFTIVSNENKEDIEEKIKEKRGQSDVLKAANLVIIDAEEEDVEEAVKEGKAVGLNALREKYGLQEDETLGDMMRDPERRAEFMESKRMIEEDFGHQTERIMAHVAAIEDDVLKEAFEEFLSAKGDFMDAIEAFQDARKAYQAALQSGDDEAIADAFVALQEAEAEKDRLEAEKDRLEAAKDDAEKAYEEGEAANQEDEGKPEDAGKPEDTGKPATIGKPEDAGKPKDAGKPGKADAEDETITYTKLRTFEN